LGQRFWCESGCWPGEMRFSHVGGLVVDGVGAQALLLPEARVRSVFARPSAPEDPHCLVEALHRHPPRRNFWPSGQTFQRGRLAMMASVSWLHGHLMGGLVEQARIGMLGVALSAGGCSNPTIGTWVAEHYEGMVAATPLSFSYPPGTLVRVNGDVRLSVLADDCLPQTEEFEPLVGAETSVAGTQAISVGAEATIPSVEDAVEALAEAGGEIIGSVGGEFDYESEIQVTLVGGRIVSFDDRQVRMLASVLSQECWDWLRQGAELVIRSLDVNEI